MTAAPDICTRCVWHCPWNGLGFGCSHPGYMTVLEGRVLCGGAEFRQSKPFHWPPNIAVLPE